MAALPYMQLYIADYLADTMHLSTEEHGAYLLLMFNYWQTGRAIPKSRLGKIARLSNDRWISVESSLAEFFNDNGTEWVHERIERDLEGVRSSLEQKSAAGKASAMARKAKKTTPTQRGANGRSTVVDSPLQREGNENPTNKDPDKDTDIKHKNIMSGAEKNQHQTRAAIPPEEIFISLPLIGGMAYPVTLEYLTSRSKLYPAVDVQQEFRNMFGWLESNPAKRKTPNGIKKFITTWLQRCQDTPRNRQVTNGQNNSGSGGSAANAVRAERERRERQQPQHGGTERVEGMGNAGGSVWESLGNEEWIESVNAMGEASFRDDGKSSE
ncbi:DUF1376 domain-containing protein [Enterobacteriaceae bacterium H20N1]|uniref:DUF1376 domain-containing protein n=1 Tax=Dryocola boscaweniae TaxID=2925397 RepID=A0A9X2W6W0_9ENTR|nr:DUF1376 domain-containing protein [Dryocola boscaweniae]MCT4701188.1 DUF1376 domain-containing protein [Dryocola boscaweniae]MCT4718307.1 DUF1376 domain-containing protein [Dryocola boscaweniae]